MYVKLNQENFLEEIVFDVSDKSLQPN